MRNNSVIYKNPEENYIFDLSYFGTIFTFNKRISINKKDHLFQVCDILYYDIYTKHFEKALSINTIESEACCAVYKVIDKDNFIVVTNGIIATKRYDNFKNNTKLYLSDIIPGQITDEITNNVVKPIGVKVLNGIYINVLRSFTFNNDIDTDIDDYEQYTEEELNKIIEQSWWR